jgi:hypothetical protein
MISTTAQPWRPTSPSPRTVPHKVFLTMTSVDPTDPASYFFAKASWWHSLMCSLQKISGRTSTLLPHLCISKMRRMCPFLLPYGVPLHLRASQICIPVAFLYITGVLEVVLNELLCFVLNKDTGWMVPGAQVRWIMAMVQPTEQAHIPTAGEHKSLQYLPWLKFCTEYDQH